jgi:tripartite-type tricarboxylate transporter receptor subunit TctC
LKERHRLLPIVPSVDESKVLKGFHYTISTGYFINRDVPEAIVNRLHPAISTVLADAEVRASLTTIGLDVGAPLALSDAAIDCAARGGELSRNRQSHQPTSAVIALAE